jgi:hypothetical protein
LLEFSIVSQTSCRLGDCGGLPNSVMSAPAMNVRPSQISDGLLHAFDDAVAHLLRQRVNGRRIDGQHGDVALRGQIRNGVDGPHRESPLEKNFRKCGLVRRAGIIGR